MEDTQQRKLSTALVMKILDVKDPDFAHDLLKGKPEKQKEVLYRFLEDMEYEGDKVEVLNHLTAVLKQTDLNMMEGLRDELDGPVEIPF